MAKSQVVPQGRPPGVPTHIIVSTGEPIAQAVRSVLSVARTRAAVGAKSARVFEELKVAAANLSDKDAAELENRGLIVAENHRRVIQGWEDSGEESPGEVGVRRSIPDGGGHRPIGG